MFKPIIHNLTPDNPGYAACNAYNAHIAVKPAGNHTLAAKIALQRDWHNQAEYLLEKAKEALV